MHRAILLLIAMLLVTSCLQPAEFSFQGATDVKDGRIVEVVSDLPIGDVPIHELTGGDLDVADAADITDVPLLDTPDVADMLGVDLVDAADTLIEDVNDTADLGEIEVCTPDCDGKECGDDGCGGECGTCGDFGGCKPDFTCLCEHEKCGGTCCSEMAICFEEACCEANCEGRECGDDGCGGSCWLDDDLEECDDGWSCTDTGPCDEDGQCINATHDELCGDENPCTTDLCDAALGCIFQNNGLPCDDNEPCTTGDTCASGSCIAGPPKTCNDDIDCTQDFCTSGIGCQFTPNDGLCDDGNVCTAENCNADTGCVVVSVGGACDDGNACTLEDSCVNGLCEPGVALVCDDENTCTDDTCAPESGCLFVSNDDNDCSNEDACDGLESCVEGECIPGDAPVCDDQVDCTDDSCDAELGCQYLPNDESCDDANPCTDNICDNAAGCQFLPNDALACTDEDECTLNDTCSAGECLPGLFDEENCGAQFDYDHDGAIKDDDLCPYAFDPGNPDVNGIAGPDACEPLSLHGQFQYSVAVDLDVDGSTATARRTHEPVELPLVSGIMDDSVVGYWTFDDGQALDYSGHEAHGTISGALNSEGAFGDEDGALDFDGQDDFVELPDGFAIPHQQFTLAAWVRVDGLDSYCEDYSWMNVIGRGPAHKIGPRIAVGSRPGFEGVVMCNIFRPGNTYEFYAIMWDGPISTGTYRHLACTWDRTDLLLYVDGQLASTHPLETNTWEDPSGSVKAGSGPVLLGNHPDYTEHCANPDGPFNGALDEVIVASRPWSHHEIATYVSSSRPFATPIVPGAQADFDDLRLTETPGPGDPEDTGEVVKRARIIGPRPHSDTPCPYGEEVPVDTIPGIADREDLCGVMAYWPLDNDAVDVVGDFDGSASNVKVHRGRFGRQEQALAFSAEDESYVVIPGSGSLCPDTAGTLETWFSLSSIGTTQTLLTKPAGNKYTNIGLTVLSSGELRGYLIKSGAFFYLVGGTVSPGSWHHAALTFNESETRLYLDGELVDKTNAPGLFNCDPKNWFFGKYYNFSDVTDHLDGALDDVLLHAVAKSPDYIYNRANPGVPTLRFLANSVVENQGTEETPSYPARGYKLHWGDDQAHMVVPMVPHPTEGTAPCHGLLSTCHGYAAWWRLNEGRGTTAVDNSTNKMNGTYMGANSWAPGIEGLAFANNFSPAYVLIGDNEGLYHSNATLEAAFALGLDVDGETPTNQFLAGKALPNNKDDYIWNIFHTSGALRFAVEPPGLEQQAIESDSAQWSTGQWHTTAVTLGKGGLYQFVDGAEQADNKAEHTGGIKGDGVDLTLGAFLEYEEYFNGLLDSFRIMNRALTSDEFLHYPMLTPEPSTSNWAYTDTDGDGILDDGDFSGVVGDTPCLAGQLHLCDDNAPMDPNPDQDDSDGDGIATVLDNCPETANPDQTDANGDGWGDVCGLLEDYDHDGMVEDDLCPLAYDPGNPDDNDIDGPDACEALSDHGEFTWQRSVAFSVAGDHAGERRTHEPVELPLVNGLIDDSLVLYLPFDGELLDRSLYGNQPVAIGSIDFSDSLSPAMGQALDLASASNRIESYLADDQETPELLTVMAWVHPMGTAGGAIVGRQYHNQVVDDQWRVYSGNGTFAAELDDAQGQHAEVAYASLTDNDAWSHVAMVLEPPNSLTLYVNGQLRDRDTVNSLSTLASDLPIAIGDFVGSGTSEWSGLVDEVLVFNRALSPQEIGSYVAAQMPWGSSLVPGGQSDFDDVRLVESPVDGDPPPVLPAIKRTRVIGPRPHSDSPCPELFSGWLPADIPAITEREDLCGVVGYWKLDGDGSDTTGKHSGVVTKALPTTGRFGDSSGALAFAPNSNVLPPYSADFDLQQFSLEAWIRYSANDPAPSTSDQIVGNTDGGGYALTVDEGNLNLITYFEDLPVHEALAVPLPPGATDRWLHIAGSYGSGEMRLYVDGYIAAAKYVGKPVRYSPQSPVVVGDDPNLGLPSQKQNFHGAIDEVLIHGVAKAPDYFYHRAHPGMPTLRFLANTVVENDGTPQSPSYPARDYEMSWGNADALLPFTSVRTAANGKLCYGLLNECLGYQGWWRFNETATIVAVDSTTAKRSGTLTGATSFRAGADWSGMYTSLTGAVIPDSPGLHVAEGTLEMAFKPFATIDETLAKNTVLMQKKSGGNDDGFYYILTSVAEIAGRLRFLLYDQETSATIELLSDGNSWLADTLYTTAITFGLDGMAMVVDGVVQQDTDSHAGGISAPGVDLQLGAGFYGICDSYRLMSRPLSLDEMLHYPLVTPAAQTAAGPSVCGGVVCPVLAGYGQTCNAQSFCQYVNEDDTGWRAFDIWIWVPPGTYAMGDKNNLVDADDELPEHPVSQGGFFIARYEAPVVAYEACVADNATCAMAAAADWDGAGWGTNKSLKGQVAHPQNGLSWTQAGTFCQWLAPGGRLPTEAEWEYAASGPLARTYPWGNTPAPSCDHDMVVFSPTQSTPDYGCGSGGTHPVHTFATGYSWCGAAHMAGNVWEWVADWYHEDYSGAPTDGSAWEEPAGTERVLRGGSFADGGAELRGSNRASADPNKRAAHVGVRCVRPAP